MRSVLPLAALLLVTSSCEFIGGREPSGGLAGTAWRLVSLRDADGTERAVPADEPYTLRFDSDGVLAGSMDCNGFGGSYSSGAGRLMMNINGMTRAYCGDDSLDDIVYAAVERVQAFERSGGQLVLTYRRLGRLVLNPEVP